MFSFIRINRFSEKEMNDALVLWKWEYCTSKKKFLSKDGLTVCMKEYMYNLNYSQIDIRISV